jgi:hypothetical protein
MGIAGTFVKKKPIANNKSPTQTNTDKFKWNAKRERNTP